MNWLKKRQIESGLRPGTYARMIGIDRRHFEYLAEPGHLPGAKTVEKIAENLGIDPVELWREVMPSPDG